MTEPTLDTLTRRLDRLEGEVRRWRRAGPLLLAVVGALAVMGQALPKIRVVEAEKLILRDPDGKVRVILGSEWPRLDVSAPPALNMVLPKSGVYGLHIYSSDGKYKAGLTEAAPAGTGAQLELHDGGTPSSVYVTVGAGAAAVNLTATEESKATAERADSEWAKKFNAAKTPQERERLILGRPFEGVSAALSAFPKGTSSLSLERSSHGARGGINVYLLKDQASIWLSDERGTGRAVLGGTTLENKTTGVAEQRPASSLVLFDKDGKVIWKAP